MTDPFFRIRPSKRSNPEARTTLDSVHQHYLSKAKDVHEQVATLKGQYSNLQEQYNASQNDIDRFRLEQEIKQIKAKIESVDENGGVFNYYLQNGELLFQY